MSEDISRRRMLKAAGATLGAAAFARAVAPLAQFTESTNMEEFLTQHYRELGPEDKTRLIARLQTSDDERWELCWSHAPGVAPR